MKRNFISERYKKIVSSLRFWSVINNRAAFSSGATHRKKPMIKAQILAFSATICAKIKFKFLKKIWSHVIQTKVDPSMIRSEEKEYHSPKKEIITSFLPYRYLHRSLVYKSTFHNYHVYLVSRFNPTHKNPHSFNQSLLDTRHRLIRTYN